MSFTEKFQAGEAYGDPQRESSNFFADPTKLVELIKGLLQKGEPLDDKKGTTELLIGILTSLPSTSSTRTKLTNKLIDTLWDNLQHPPLSYVGGDVKYEVINSEGPIYKEKPKPYDSIEFKAPDSDIILRERVPESPDGLYQYRMPDGSFNNILQPNLGKAGTPYAKTIRTVKRL
ncbi:hypothetical protein JDV02_003484 [Purpureocillium takamizusanense]|uniref:Uncharacterized protein n=1 Tax=Purpureocillium takamizusanense TaxID=2060973 RepID=A0A9Q8QBP3_9HYPO|nr:uncharacterized protein JDV02_003484 [Purpureocillium takamizusanense]UNI17108.1 hypothetical protein JDV02_003484 [Purpureocillium takamizusanense]